MRRFITLTLAVLVGAATASLRLGEYCDTNASCNSGLCYQGVCRASNNNSTIPALANKMIRAAGQQRSQLKTELKSALVSKIINFSRRTEGDSMHQRFKSNPANDMQQNSLDSQFRAKLADNVRSFASSRSESSAPTPDINAQLRQSLMKMMTRMNTEGGANNQTNVDENSQNNNSTGGNQPGSGSGEGQENPTSPTEAPASSAWVWILIVVGLIAAGAGGFYVYKRKQSAAQGGDGYNKVTA